MEMLSRIAARHALRRTAAPARAFSLYVNHRDTQDNTEQTPFEFCDDVEKEREFNENLQTLLNKYPSNYKKSAVIPALMMAQKMNDNFLSLAAMNKVAKVLEMPQMAVYEVASFYTMFNRTRVGKYHLQVCGTTPCMLRGSREIISAIENHLGIGNNQTTEDGLFTLQEVECLGACANAPMMQVSNEWFYEDLTPENTVRLAGLTWVDRASGEHEKGQWFQAWSPGGH